MPGLDETDVSGDISSDVAIIVERSMYRNLPNQPFGLGTDSMGVTAAATRWFLAEGATGTFFDHYVLIANPGEHRRPGDRGLCAPGRHDRDAPVRRGAHSRFSVFVDAIPGLEATSLATTVTSTNSVPIVVERAMYWPNGFFSYYEGHSSAGSTTAAQRWVVASGNDRPSETYVLIANTENRAGEVELRALPRVNEDVFAPPPLTVQLPPKSRTTVPTNVIGGVMAYGVLVTSTGPSPVALVVESAAYRSTDVVWSSGTNALATPVPSGIPVAFIASLPVHKERILRLSLFVCASILAIAAPAAAQITRVSVSTTGTQGNQPSIGGVSISGDRAVCRLRLLGQHARGGRYADQPGYLPARPGHRRRRIFDEPGAVATTRINVGPSGAEADANSSRPVITPDGRFVVFESQATNLLPGAIAGLTQMLRLESHRPAPCCGSARARPARRPMRTATVP